MTPMHDTPMLKKITENAQFFWTLFFPLLDCDALTFYNR